MASKSDQLPTVGHGFQVVNLGPARNDDQVGRPGGSQGRLFGPGRGVDDRQINAALPGFLERLGKPGGLGVDNDRGISLAPVGSEIGLPLFIKWLGRLR